jgi:ABC-type antimicrobial peptide transport system permease subunit
MGFALVIVLLNFSLMVAQAKEEVSLLIQLGYRSSDLVRHLLIYLIIFISTVSLMVAVIFGVGNYLLADFFHQNGLEISRTLSPEVVIAGICFVLLSLLLSYFSITRLIRKQL